MVPETPPNRLADFLVGDRQATQKQNQQPGGPTDDLSRNWWIIATLHRAYQPRCAGTGTAGSHL